MRACKFDAIHIDEHSKIAVVDSDKCTACGACVAACPKKVLDLQPVTLPVRVLCRAAEEGFLVSDNCRIGCVGCELCKEACKFGAITMVNHLPVIDRSKCVGCMMCAEVCPTSAMWGDFDNRRIALIDRDLCIGCGICKKTASSRQSPASAEHPRDQRGLHGCGQCVPKCPKKAITLPIRLHVRDANAKVGTSRA